MTEEINKIQPVHEVYDGLANAKSGKLINFHAPTASMICIEDIATGLCNICRFGGQIQSNYTVGQHTLLVWHLVPDHLKEVALLHDAAEAYVGDVIKPLKNLLGRIYQDIEDRFQTVIFNKYGVDQSLIEELKPFDNLATEIEFNYFRKGKMDFIQKFYEINELLGEKKPKKQLLTLLNSHFLEKELEAAV